MNYAVAMGLAAFWLVGVVRRLPRVESWVMSEIKPWACDACMSFWSVGMIAGVRYLATGYYDVLFALSAAGVCMAMLLLAAPRIVLPPPPPAPTGPPPVPPRRTG